jgi:hypothetical protein
MPATQAGDERACAVMIRSGAQHRDDRRKVAFCLFVVADEV